MEIHIIYFKRFSFRLLELRSMYFDDNVRYCSIYWCVIKCVDNFWNFQAFRDRLAESIRKSKSHYRFEVQINTQAETQTVDCIHSHSHSRACYCASFYWHAHICICIYRLASIVWLKYRRTINTTSYRSVKFWQKWKTTHSLCLLKSSPRSAWSLGHICVHCTLRRRCHVIFSPCTTIASMVVLVNRLCIVAATICMATQNHTPNVSATAISQRIFRTIATPFVIRTLTLNHT